MKHIIVTLLLAWLTALTASAQAGLNINRLFDGRHKSSPDATETWITGGKQLAAWHLSRYHSLTINNRADSARDVEQLVLLDAAKARARETSYIDSRLYYGFFTLAPEEGENRYIFYLNQHLKGGNRVILIYMQGKATPSQIKKILNR